MFFCLFLFYITLYGNGYVCLYKQYFNYIVVVSFIVGCVVIPGNENILFYLISGIDGKG